MDHTAENLVFRDASDAKRRASSLRKSLEKRGIQARLFSCLDAMAIATRYPNWHALNQALKERTFSLADEELFQADLGMVIKHCVSGRETQAILTEIFGVRLKIDASIEPPLFWSGVMDPSFADITGESSVPQSSLGNNVGGESRYAAASDFFRTHITEPQRRAREDLASQRSRRQDRLAEKRFEIDQELRLSIDRQRKYAADHDAAREQARRSAN